MALSSFEEKEEQFKEQVLLLFEFLKVVLFFKILFHEGGGAVLWSFICFGPFGESYI